MCKEYSGWTNYETWNINLWLSEDGDTYRMIEDMIDNPYSSDAVYELSQGIRKYVEDSNPLGDDSSMYADLLGAAISSCSFYEIAEHWIEDYCADNPETVKTEPQEYAITLPSLPYIIEYHVENMHPDGDSDGQPTFWNAFNWAIKDAMYSGLDSIVIAWYPDEIENKHIADRLIAKQATRSTRKDA